MISDGWDRNKGDSRIGLIHLKKRDFNEDNWEPYEAANACGQLKRFYKR